VTDSASHRTDAEAAVAALRGARRVSAICHENPDADTIGGAIAIAIIAERLGKESEVVSVDDLPTQLAFLPRFAAVHRRPELEPDLAVLCDAATLERAGRLTREHGDWLARATIVNIDHHVTNTGFGNVNLVDPEAAATCQVITELLPELDLRPDAELATVLLAGIVRDSHGFSDPSTSPRTLRCTAELMEAGGELATIQRRILNELPFSTMALWGRMMAGLGERAGGRVVFATLTEAMLEETGTQQPDADGLVEFLAKAARPQITILFRELGDSATRVSLRTVDGVDATAIARRFGGGGHARRAGFVAGVPVAAFHEEVLEACVAAVADRPAR
jgi:phosphoesterase RecJ-like protein